jgi:hypothetical protein
VDKSAAGFIWGVAAGTFEGRRVAERVRALYHFLGWIASLVSKIDTCRTGRLESRRRRRRRRRHHRFRLPPVRVRVRVAISPPPTPDLLRHSAVFTLATKVGRTWLRSYVYPAARLCVSVRARLCVRVCACASVRARLWVRACLYSECPLERRWLFSARLMPARGYFLPNRAI